MSETVEIDADVLQYLNETAVAHGILIQALLHAQEQRQPGFSQMILTELDKQLGQRSEETPNPGLVKIRERVRADLEAATEAVQGGRE